MAGGLCGAAGAGARLQLKRHGQLAQGNAGKAVSKPKSSLLGCKNWDPDAPRRDIHPSKRRAAAVRPDRPAPRAVPSL